VGKKSKFLVCGGGRALLLSPLILFFTLLFFKTLNIPLPTPSHPIAFYTNQGRDNLKLLTVKLIKEAKSSLSLASYHLTDPDIIAQLNHKSATIPITLYLDHSNRRVRKKLHPNIELHLIKMGGLMHEKILLIDETYTLLGSANMTESSLLHHDNIMTLIHHPPLAGEVKKHLKNLSQKLPTPPITCQLGEQSLTLHFTPDQNNCLLTHMIDNLANSEASIFVSMFTLTHPKLIDTLATHSAKVTLDASASKGSSRKAKARLAPRISRNPFLFHHKWALIDERTLLLGSLNWTRGGLKKNADYLMTLSPLTPDQNQFFNKLRKRIHCESN